MRQAGEDASGAPAEARTPGAGRLTAGLDRQLTGMQCVACPPALVVRSHAHATHRTVDCNMQDSTKSMHGHLRIQHCASSASWYMSRCWCRTSDGELHYARQHPVPCPRSSVCCVTWPDLSDGNHLWYAFWSMLARARGGGGGGGAPGCDRTASWRCGPPLGGPGTSEWAPACSWTAAPESAHRGPCTPLTPLQNSVRCVPKSAPDERQRCRVVSCNAAARGKSQSVQAEASPLNQYGQQHERFASCVHHLHLSSQV